MWVFLNDAFLSIVVPPRHDLPRGLAGRDVLAVRARRREDIERTFPGSRIVQFRNRDYQYRAFVTRQRVAEMLAGRVETMNATNFKGSVRDRGRHDAYMSVWAVMNRWGDGGYEPRHSGMPLFEEDDE